jgi:hypothetical protein
MRFWKGSTLGHRARQAASPAPTGRQSTAPHSMAAQGPLEIGHCVAASRTCCPRGAREGAPAVRTFAGGP